MIKAFPVSVVLLLVIIPSLVRIHASVTSPLPSDDEDMVEYSGSGDDESIPGRSDDDSFTNPIYEEDEFGSGGTWKRIIFNQFDTEDDTAATEDDPEKWVGLGFNESCSWSGPFCDNHVFQCIDNICKCGEDEDFDPVLYLCIPAQEPNYFEKDFNEPCKDDSECNYAAELSCQRDGNSYKGICKCLAHHDYNPSKKICERRQEEVKHVVECEHDFDCQKKKYGSLSRCSSTTEKCECWDTLKYFGGESDMGVADGKCHYKRKVNQTCRQKIECVLGYSVNADCLPSPSYNGEKVCSCSPGAKCDQHHFQGPSPSGSGCRQLCESIVIVVLLSILTHFLRL